MSDALSEVADDLGQRRRFVVPPVRDLDTGRVYAPNELGEIPRGLDPQVLSKTPKSLDLGHAICSPFLKLVPRTCLPNTISYINHAANWLLFLMAAWGHHLPEHYKRPWFLACAVLNFLCMTLDCLDGMHARATNQCSKLGEFLDHWMDAINAPLVAAGIAIAFRLPQWNIAVMGALNSMVYCSQLVVYHYQRKFHETSGVEAQLLTSVLYIIVAFSAHQSIDESPTREALFVVTWAGPFVCLYFIGTFARRFGWAEWKAYIKFIAYLAPPILLYLGNYWGVFIYSLAFSVISFRITGSYVLYSVILRPYNGKDTVLMIWLAVLLWTNLAMDPLPLSLWFTRVAPFCGFLSPFIPKVVAICSTQDALPYVFIVHIIQRNVVDFRNYYYSLKHMS